MLLLFSCFNPSITISRIHPASFEFKGKNQNSLFSLTQDQSYAVHAIAWVS